MGKSNGTERRRSPRLNSLPTQLNIDKMAPFKRSITKKITPKKTVLSSENDKENILNISGANLQKEPKASTPVPAEMPRQTKDTMPSPILATSPPSSQSESDAENMVWSQKVRRSYSRLSDQSFNSTTSRDSIFGFEELKTPTVARKKERSKTIVNVSGFLSGGDEPDPNIPGVVVVKEKRKRRKVQQIDVAELDSFAAKMNAEFEEAEGFQLVVE